MTINKGATALLGAAALAIQIIAGSADANAQARHAQPSGATSAPAHFSTPSGAVLYDQSGVVANGAATLNDGTEFSSRGADDFVVPDPNGWTVTGFNFQVQFEPAGAPASATYDLAVFPDAGGIPGATVMDGCKFLHADGTLDASQTNLQVVLPTPCVLPTGSYWISFAANFEWPPQAYWSLSDDPTIGDEGTWENPGDGFASGCTMWMPLTTCGFAQKNYLFQIVGSVNGSAPCAGGGICLDVGVAVQDPANPDLCGIATSLDILAGQAVDFCYTVTNGTGLPLEFHSLTDNVNGQILDVEPASLAPGATLTHHRVATIDASQSVISTWTALTELPGYDHTTGDLDPGMPSDCADRFFADGFDSTSLPCDGAIPGDFIDISTTGVALDLGDDDAVAFDMPFSFNLYGQTSNRLCIGNNGIVLFGIATCDTATFALNRPLPYDGFAGAALLPFWDDLFTGGNVYTQTIGLAPKRQFVVEWFEKDHFDDGSQGIGGVTFEVVFSEDGSLDYNYLKTTFEADPLWDDGGSATIGLQKDPAVAEEFSFETPSLRNLFFIDWTLRNQLTFTDTDDGVTINVSAPHIELPDSLSGTSTVGTSTNVTLDIGNTGTSDLHWVLDEVLSAAQGGSCANPADVPWLSMAPTNGTTAPSMSQPATVTLDATALPAGDYAATICVASDDSLSPIVAIPVAFAVTPVAGPIPPTLTKAFSPATVVVGIPSTLTITLTNSNAVPADLTTQLTDLFPAAVRLATPPNATNTCGGTLTASAGSSFVTLESDAAIPANGSCTVTVDVTADASGDHVNTIAANALQTTAGSNALATSATLSATPQTPPTITKTFTPAAVGIDSPSRLTITLGNSNASDVSLTAALTDTFPNGLVISPAPNATFTCGGAASIVAGAGSLTIPFGQAAIPANGTCALAVDVQSATAGDYVNTIAAGALQTTAGNNATDASASLSVLAGPMPPTLTKTFTPTSVTTGTPSTLTITLANTNATPANLSATFTDTFPAGLVVATVPNASTTCGGALNAPAGSGTVSLDNAGSSIPANGTCSIDVDVQAAAASDYTNTIGAGSLQADTGTNATDASATLTVTAPIVPPTIDVTLSPTSVALNASSTLTLTLGNSNAAAANLSADLVDTLPAGLVVAPVPNAATTCGGAVNAVAGTNTITLIGAGSAIPAGGTCTVSADVTATVAGAYSNTLPVDALQTSAGNNAAPASDSVVVTGTFPAPYCAVTALTSVEPITKVDLAGIANPSSATVDAGGSATQSEDFLAVTGGALAPTGGYTITVQGNTDGNGKTSCASSSTGITTAFSRPTVRKALTSARSPTRPAMMRYRRANFSSYRQARKPD